jgi:hypothetical protein
MFGEMKHAADMSGSLDIFSNFLAHFFMDNIFYYLKNPRAMFMPHHFFTQAGSPPTLKF